MNKYQESDKYQESFPDHEHSWVSADDIPSWQRFDEPETQESWVEETQLVPLSSFQVDAESIDSGPMEWDAQDYAISTASHTPTSFTGLDLPQPHEKVNIQVETPTDEPQYTFHQIGPIPDELLDSGPMEWDAQNYKSVTENPRQQDDTASELHVQDPSSSRSQTGRLVDPNRFVHLHLHTEHSPLDGLSRVADIVRVAKEDGAGAVAITDHGNLNGWYTLRTEARKAGIKPIYGVEAYLALGRREDHDYTSAESFDGGEGDEDAKEKKKTYYHLTVLAKNHTGFLNLVKMMNAAEDSFWHHPRIDYELLKEYGEGLIVLTGCLGGPVMSALAKPLPEASLVKIDDIEGELCGAQVVDLIRCVCKEVYGEQASAKILALWDEAMPLEDEAEFDGIDTKLASLVENDPVRASSNFDDVLALVQDVFVGDAKAGEHSRGVGKALSKFVEAVIRKPKSEAQKSLVRLSKKVAKAHVEEAQEHLDAMFEAVGRDNVFAEVMDHKIPAEVKALPLLVKLAKKNGISLVATNDGHYTHENDDFAHDAWLCVRTGDTVDNPNRAFSFNGEGYHYRTACQMRGLRKEKWWKEACDNTVLIADQIEDDALKDLGMQLPKFSLPEGVTDSKLYLRELVHQGALQRYGEDPDNPGQLPPQVQGRLDFEHKIISNAGVDDYFLILWDLIEWAESDRGMPTKEYPRGEPGKKKPIRTGLGRGSAAGSAVSYCLNIVKIDPIDHELLFERFLNPERVGMPDIDTDFEKLRRGEVWQYLIARYGYDRVARIGTFQMDKSKGALRDAAKAIGKSGVGNKLAAAIPMDGPQPRPLGDVLDPRIPGGEHFRKTASDLGVDDSELIIDTAQRMENVTRGVSIHACATLVSDKRLTGLVPMRYIRDKGNPVDGEPRVAAWEGGSIEKYGFLKLDLLGLKQLDIIALALDYASEAEGCQIEIPTLKAKERSADPKVRRAFELIARGQTAGVFQLGSSGMTELAEQVVPETLSDLTALLALYRPGPMSEGMHLMYADRKNGREEVSLDYLTIDTAEQEVIGEVLLPTYGVICYQESLMRLGTAVAGMDGAATNKLRKAFSKKIPALMEEVHESFTSGALAGKGPRGVKFKKETVEQLWRTFDASASYLFNKSHAAAYGVTAFQTAYLKANWPAAFGAATLAIAEREDDRRAVINSLFAEGVQVFNPDINYSKAKSAPTPTGDVIIGLAEVKEVGVIAGAIMKARENGPFKGLDDFITRTTAAGKKPSAKAIEALIQAGAFDQFGPRLGQFLVARALGSAHYNVEWEPFEKGARERSRLGFTVGPHPLITQAKVIEASLDAASRKASTDPAKVLQAKDGSYITIIAILAALTIKDGRHGRYAHLSFELANREIVPAVMWSSGVQALEEDDDLPVVGYPVKVVGKVRSRVIETDQTNEDGTVTTVSQVRTEIVVDRIRTIHVPRTQPPVLDSPPLPRRVIRVGGLPGIPSTHPARNVPFPKETPSYWIPGADEEALLYDEGTDAWHASYTTGTPGQWNQVNSLPLPVNPETILDQQSPLDGFAPQTYVSGEEGPGEEMPDPNGWPKESETEMANDTYLTITGNLTADPQLHYFQDGKAVCNFNVASTPRAFDRQAGEWRDGKTLFQKCSCWAEMAENVAASLHKGDAVIAYGRLSANDYENKEGQKVQSTQLDVEAIGPDLRRATVPQVIRNPKKDQGQFPAQTQFQGANQGQTQFQGQPQQNFAQQAPQGGQAGQFPAQPQFQGANQGQPQQNFAQQAPQGGQAGQFPAQPQFQGANQGQPQQNFAQQAPQGGQAGQFPAQPQFQGANQGGQAANPW